MATSVSRPRTIARPALAANDALSLLLEDRQARVSNGRGANATVAFYEKTSGHLVRYFGHDFRVAEFKDSTRVWQFIDARRREKAKDTSIQKEVTTLRAALRLGNGSSRPPA